VIITTFAGKYISSLAQFRTIHSANYHHVKLGR